MRTRFPGICDVDTPRFSRLGALSCRYAGATPESKDHVHLLVSIPPSVTVSRLVQRMKGNSSHKLLYEFEHLRRTFWGRHLWARGYFCCSSGQVTDEVIARYIENQGQDEDVDFRVEGE